MSTHIFYSRGRPSEREQAIHMIAKIRDQLQEALQTGELTFALHLEVESILPLLRSELTRLMSPRPCPPPPKDRQDVVLDPPAEVPSYI